MGGYSLNQHDYSAFYNGRSNVGCCAVSYAMGVSIVTGIPRDPTKYWRGNQTYYTDSPVGWVSYDAAEIYAALKNGEPTMLNYTYANSSGQHWVLIVGVRDGADENNLQMEDFEAIDPNTGDKRKLTETYKFNPNGVNGGWRIRK
jgi:formylglycine-generating enzyme required for sulfatase activity